MAWDMASKFCSLWTAVRPLEKGGDGLVRVIVDDRPSKVCGPIWIIMC